jgi:hypothetical protein
MACPRGRATSTGEPGFEPDPRHPKCRVLPVTPLPTADESVAGRTPCNARRTMRDSAQAAHANEQGTKAVRGLPARSRSPGAPRSRPRGFRHSGRGDPRRGRSIRRRLLALDGSRDAADREPPDQPVRRGLPLHLPQRVPAAGRGQVRLAGGQPCAGDQALARHGRQARAQPALSRHLPAARLGQRAAGELRCRRTHLGLRDAASRRR